MTQHFDFDNVLNWNVKNEKLIAVSPRAHDIQMAMYWMLPNLFVIAVYYLYTCSFVMFSCQVFRNKSRFILKSSRWSLLKYLPIQNEEKKRQQLKCVNKPSALQIETYSSAWARKYTPSTVFICRSVHDRDEMKYRTKIAIMYSAIFPLIQNWECLLSSCGACHEYVLRAKVIMRL